jgi:ABC-type glycerol-3-phosphate transport system substrate-binding protein
MLYILLDNYDQGLEMDEVDSFDDLAKYLEKMKEAGDSYDRIQHIIFGEEVPWDVIRTYYNLQE